jgi:hypothetical protein
VTATRTERQVAGPAARAHRLTLCQTQCSRPAGARKIQRSWMKRIDIMMCRTRFITSGRASGSRMSDLDAELECGKERQYLCDPRSCLDQPCCHRMHMPHSSLSLARPFYVRQTLRDEPA